MTCRMSGVSVAMPSRTAAREGARLTTRVLPDTPDEPARQPGVDGARGQPGRADRLGDAGNRPVQDARRRVRGDVTRRDARAPHRDHEVDATDHRGVERVADRDRVTGHHDHCVDHQPGLFEQFANQGADGVLALPVARTVVHDHDERATDLRGGHLHDVTVAGDADDGGGGSGADRAGAGRGCRRRRDPSCPPTAGHHGRGPSTDTRHDATRFINLCGIPDIFTPTGRSE